MSNTPVGAKQVWLFLSLLLCKTVFGKNYTKQAQTGNSLGGSEMPVTDML